MLLIADCQCRKCRAASRSGLGIRHIVHGPRDYFERLLALLGGPGPFVLCRDTGEPTDLAIGRKANGRLRLYAHS